MHNIDPISHLSNNISELLIASHQSKSAININWQGYIVCGNNQQLLLEQLEQVGISIPYSCRAGICGLCRIKLVKGKVIWLKKSVIIEEGNILCCSCIPQTTIQLLP